MNVLLLMRQESAGTSAGEGAATEARSRMHRKTRQDTARTNERARGNKNNAKRIKMKKVRGAGTTHARSQRPSDPLTDQLLPTSRAARLVSQRNPQQWLLRCLRLGSYEPTAYAQLRTQDSSGHRPQRLSTAQLLSIWIGSSRLTSSRSTRRSNGMLIILYIIAS